MNELLIKVLAETDAVHLPHRSWGGHLGSVICFARLRFPGAGVVWRSAGVNAAERVAIGRELRRLADTGMVRLYRARGAAKTGGVALTDRADEETRSSCGLPTVADSYAVMTAMLSAMEAGDCSASSLVPETVLADCAWGSPSHTKKLVALEDELLPALHRGWIVSHSDLAGRVWYSLTASGRAALASGLPARSDKALPAPDPDAREQYLIELSAAQDRLAAAVPDDPRDIGLLPLSCSIPLRGDVHKLVDTQTLTATTSPV